METGIPHQPDLPMAEATGLQEDRRLQHVHQMVLREEETDYRVEIRHQHGHPRLHLTEHQQVHLLQTAHHHQIILRVLLP